MDSNIRRKAKESVVIKFNVNNVLSAEDRSRKLKTEGKSCF